MESLCFHVVPNHFYYPIPDTDDLLEKEPRKQTYLTEGSDWQEEEQLDLLNEFSEYFSEYSSSGSGFESNGDGPILYAMVRKFKPGKIIEIGSGSSTNVALTASRRNEQESGAITEVTPIEPYPNEELQKLAEKHHNHTLIESRAEEIAVEDYCQLNDSAFC